MGCTGQDVNGSVDKVPDEYQLGTVRISLGYDFTCAINDANATMCWGDDKKGKLNVPF